MVRVEAARPSYKAMVITQVGVDGGLELVNGRGGGGKDLWSAMVVEPSGLVSGLYVRVKSDVVLHLFGNLLTGSQITGISHFWNL